MRQTGTPWTEGMPTVTRAAAFWLIAAAFICGLFVGAVTVLALTR